MDFYRMFRTECENSFAVKTEESHGIFTFRPVWKNNSSHPVGAAEANIIFSLPEAELLPVFCCGSMRQGSHWERFSFDELNELKKNAAFSGHALLRTVSGKTVLPAVVTCRKNLAVWRISKGRLELHCYGDGRMLQPGEEWCGDLYCFIEGSSSYEVLKNYGNFLAEKNPRIRRRQNTVWRGWGSWDYYGDKFNEDQLLKNFTATRKLYPGANLLQVDDGAALWGDWLEIKPDYMPHGMTAFVNRVKELDAHAGLWMAPFWAEHKSKVFQEHPEWFLRHDDGSLVIEYMGPHTLSLLDYTQDAVCDWWRNIVHTARREWGFEYFKFDFLSRGLCPVAGKDRSMSPVERFHRCLDIIEEEAGDDTFVLGCSAVFPPLFGRVDAVRTGPDVSPRFKLALSSAFGSISALHICGPVLRGDGDYLVARAREDEDPEWPVPAGPKQGNLTLGEAKLWGDVVTLFNGTILASDNMTSLRPERAEIVREVLESPVADEVYAVDLFNGDGSLPPSVLLARRGEKIELALFNWSELPRTITVLDENNGLFMQHELQAHSSVRQELSTTRSFADLAVSLHSDEPAASRTLAHFDCPGFALKGAYRPLPLGAAVNAAIRYVRSGKGMEDGKYEPVLQAQKLCGIPFDFSLDSGMVIQQLHTDEKGFSVPLALRARALYFVQVVCLPVRGELTTYTFTYADGTRVAEKQIVGEHFGNTDFRYSMPWKGTRGHLGWYDPVNYASLFVTEWINPFPDKELVRVESSAMLQRGKHYVIGLTALI